MPQVIEDEDIDRLVDPYKRAYNSEKLDKINEDIKRVIKSIEELPDQQKKFYNLEEILKQFEDAIDAIDDKTIYDRIHDLKRQVGFTMLDYLIEHCLTKTDCPPRAVIEFYHHNLIDISIEEYIHERALYYSRGENKIGIDDYDRHFISENRIKGLLNCPKSCKLPSELFLNFIKEIMTDEKKKLGIRNRKAYWHYLTYQHHPDHDSEKDYEGACGFAERFHGYFWELNQTKNYKLSDEEKAKLINESNKLHILNGFELFQGCVMKRILSISNQNVA